MSEREGGAESAGAAGAAGGAGGPGGAGFGGFLLGLAVGAAIGFLFAPEAGSGSPRPLAGQLPGVRDPAAHQGGQLRGLGDEARAGTPGGCASAGGGEGPG